MDIYYIREKKWLGVAILGLIVAAVGAYYSMGITDTNTKLICLGIINSFLIISLIGQIGQQVTTIEKKGEHGKN